jgi:predicted alpha/beta-hydrolase family hydrolase
LRLLDVYYTYTQKEKRMIGHQAKSFELEVPDAGTVTAKIDAPSTPRRGAPALLLAHGANNNLEYPLLAYVAEGLAMALGATVMRFNFPYVERGVDHGADSLQTLVATFRKAYDHLAQEVVPAGTPVFVGGKSLGGRTAAELVSRRPQSDGIQAAGLVGLGYPLHAPGRTDRLNVKPLRHIDVPSLFCTGSRDAFCRLELFEPVLPTLLAPAELFVVESGDHSLLLPRSSGRAPDAAYPEVVAKIADFMLRTLPAGSQ